MTSPDTSFEHTASFVPGEISGSVGLGKLEAMYSELFADAIDDGVITAEERAELERTGATALGLDPDRASQALESLQSVYELQSPGEDRRGRRERRAEPRGTTSRPIEARRTEARTLTLERRIAFLEQRVAELEGELAEARANVAVEVDLSGVQAGPVAPTSRSTPRLSSGA